MSSKNKNSKGNEKENESGNNWDKKCGLYKIRFIESRSKKNLKIIGLKN
jgi:hypothetical protein